MNTQLNGEQFLEWSKKVLLHVKNLGFQINLIKLHFILELNKNNKNNKIFF